MSLSLAMVALGERPQISGTAIVKDLAATWPSLPKAARTWTAPPIASPTLRPCKTAPNCSSTTV